MNSSNPYTKPDLATYPDCAEYLPSLPPEGLTDVAARPTGWLERAAPYLPGVALAGAVTIASYAMAAGIAWAMRQLETTAPLSPILLAIVLGLVLGNLVSVPVVYRSGLWWCARTVLRIGIVLLGLRLSLAAVGTMAWAAVPLVIVCIAAGSVIVLITGKLLGLSPRLASLIAVGTGICGISAIMATAPAIDAEDDEVSYAAGCITLFGLIALLTYPWLSHAIFHGDATRAGMFLGTAVHDTSQVTGAALLYSQRYDAPHALEAAMVTKLLRNLFIAGVVPGMALLHRRKTGDQLPRWWRAVPLFVVLFIVMVVLRTVGDLGERAFWLLPRQAWGEVLGWGKQSTTICLALAMAAVGIGTRLADLRRLGIRPLALGLVAAAAVGLVSFLLIRSGMIHP